jgi:hypothetical protein
MRALAGKHGGGGVVASADSVRNILENSASSHALMHADSLSPQFAEFEEEQHDLCNEEVRDLEEQARKKGTKIALIPHMVKNTAGG